MATIPSTFRIIIPAQMASPSPPIGPTLGQKGIIIGQFIKEFNEKSNNFVKGLKLNVFVKKQGKNYTIDILSPCTSHMLMHAAGVEKGSDTSRNIIGRVSLKQVYEIARIKQTDPNLIHTDLKFICRNVIRQSRAMGIFVEPHPTAFVPKVSFSSLIPKYFATLS